MNNTRASKITEQELDEGLRLILEKASKIDETLNGFYQSILQEVSKVFRLDDNSRVATEPIGAYPDGVTVMRINTPGKLFPSEFGMALTSKAGVYGFQIYSPNSSGPAGNARVFIRSWNTEMGQWTAWDEPETALGALEKANRKVDKTGDAMSGFLTLHSDPVSPKHAATKSYVDSVVQGLDIKQSVRAATTSELQISSWDSKQIRLSAAVASIDGVAMKAGDRVLVKNQSNKVVNGIYTYTNSTTMDRAEDADKESKVNSGLYTYIEEGTAHGRTGWTLTTPDPIIIGSTGLEFTQFSGANLIIPGEGIVQDGSTYSVKRTGVAPGTYTKISVNEIGQVVTGAQQTEADIPSLSASKIGSGKFHIDRLPTGTTAVTVSLGDHKHTVSQLTDASIQAPVAGQMLLYNGAKWENATLTASGVPSLDASKVGTGVFAYERMPVGSTSTTVAKGNHTHSVYETRFQTVEDSIPSIDKGAKGRVPFVKSNNSNSLEMDDLVKEAVVVNTDYDMDEAKTNHSSNVIYDARNGDVWIDNGAGGYSIDPVKKAWSEIGIGRIVSSSANSKLFFSKEGTITEISSSSSKGDVAITIGDTQPKFGWWFQTI